MLVEVDVRSENEYEYSNYGKREAGQCGEECIFVKIVEPTRAWWIATHI